VSQSFKRVLTIVGIAALAATGIGLLVAPTAVGLGFTALGGVSAAAANIGLSTLFSLGLTALSLGTTPDSSLDETGANDRGTAFYDPNALGAYVFGRTTVPASLIRASDDGQA
jgi:hypothetical protein